MSSSTVLKPIWEAFFSNLIDYAGLFPPATLSLETAVRCYYHYQESDRAWMLGRFILQASHLPQIAGLLPPDQPEPLAISLVTKNPRLDLQNAAASLVNLAGQLRLKSIEVGLSSAHPIADQLRQIQDALAILDAESGEPSLFLELAPDDDSLSSLTDLIRSIKQSPMRSSNIVGYKIRCGGLPNKAPSAERVAKALRECAREEIPLKFTAGLHHPFPLAGMDDAAHGFFNVFFAAFVANALDASEDDLISILEASPPTALAPQASEDIVSWFGFSLRASTIAELRSKRVLSFGSCSFTEPIDDAVKLAWLPNLKNISE